MRAAILIGLLACASKPAARTEATRSAPIAGEQTAGPVMLKEIYPYCIVVLPKGLLGAPTDKARKGCPDGDAACQLIVVTGDGPKDMTGSFELCENNSRDATALVGKRVMLTVVPGRVQARLCDHDPACPHGGPETQNREENVVKAITASEQP